MVCKNVVFAVVVVVASCRSGFAQFDLRLPPGLGIKVPPVNEIIGENNELRRLGRAVDPTNPNSAVRRNDPLRGHYPHLKFRPPAESTSEIAVVTPPSIDEAGNVWSGSGSGGSRGTIVGRADLIFNGMGQAWFMSRFGNIYGKPSPRRASQYDRRGNTTGNQTSPPQNAPNGQSAGSRVELRHRINPVTGQIFEGGFTNGVLKGERVVGMARLQQMPNGLWYWVANGLNPVLRQLF
ncbi:MAG: hypothetical protein O2856_14050 [Planctomycetota bacterium]|nr:hypothetical protein [Planctomycetota bacterium]